jgi:outer membrane protein OmpA-like peptidoglycan-associated protein
MVQGSKYMVQGTGENFEIRNSKFEIRNTLRLIPYTLHLSLVFFILLCLMPLSGYAQTSNSDPRTLTPDPRSQNIAYSIQIGPNMDKPGAESFLKTLPDAVKNKDAFIYQTDKGYWTVRVGITEKPEGLDELKKWLASEGIEDAAAVKTDIRKVSGQWSGARSQESGIKGESSKEITPQTTIRDSKLKDEALILPMIDKVYSTLWSVQLGSYSDKQTMEAFFQSLPDSVKRKNAFIYKGKRGYWAVRVGFAEKPEGLDELKAWLVSQGLEDIHMAKTEVKKIESKELRDKLLGRSVKEADTKTLEPEEDEWKTIYSVRLLRTENLKQVQNATIDIESKGIPTFMSENITYFKKRLYTLYVGRFLSQDEAEKAAAELSKKYGKCPVDPLFTRTIGGDSLGDIFYLDAMHTLEPKVPNRLSTSGTQENRRAEVLILLFKETTESVEKSFMEKGKGSQCIFKFYANYLYPLEEIYDISAFMSLPEGSAYVDGSFVINEIPVTTAKKGRYIVASTEKLIGYDPFTMSINVAGREDIKTEEIHYVVYGKTRNGKTLKLVTSNDEIMENEALAIYLPNPTPEKMEESEVKALIRKPSFGIIYPERNIIVSGKQTDIDVAIPVKSEYKLLINGKEADKKNLSETATDEKLGVKVVSYTAVALEDGENHIKIIVDGKPFDEKQITVTGNVARLSYEIYPKEPSADGKSSAYVMVRLLDKDGKPVKQNAYIKVYVDKGDIFDDETDSFKRFDDDGFEARVIAGEATIKLSPASTTEKRSMKVEFGDGLEKDIDVRFYPEKRPWIVNGVIEGTYTESKTKNSDEALVEYPADHSEEGSHTDVDGGVFAKGSVKDYTLTFKYENKPKDEDIILEQNIPSTEEEQYYPVYGDESEQFFEAASQDKFFVKAERGLSYFMHGDFKTDLKAPQLEYNVYDRTLNGEKINLEVKDNFKITGIHSYTSQDIVKDEQPGRGVSGPYFFGKGIPVEFSEKIYIEVRDRYHPDRVLDRQDLNRFTDYTVNYDEGWVLFKEPVHQYDDNFDLQYIVIIYETNTLAEDKHVFGGRAEKELIKGLRIGGLAASEERDVKDRLVGGLDITYDDGKGLKFVAEYTAADGYDEIALKEVSGDAKRAEISYDKEFKKFTEKGNAYFTDVEDEFQNLSTSAIIDGKQAYGAKEEFKVKKTKTTLSAEAYSEEEKDGSSTTKVASAEVKQEIGKKVSLTAGARVINEEEPPDERDITQVIGGIGIKPIEKLSINVRREQSLVDDDEEKSDRYPSKTVAGIKYSLTKKTSAYVTTELQELPEKDVALTTFGTETSLTKNTTAFAKYTIDDSISGWRNQAHSGLNHSWAIEDNFSISVGGEEVRTLSGDDSEDYTASNIGFQYFQPDKKKYTMSGKCEARFNNETDNEYVMSFGGTLKIAKDYTILARERFFDSEFDENDLLLGLAYRPVSYDKFNSLMKFRYKWIEESEEEKIVKYIGSWHANYQPNRDLTLMGEYAFKIVDDGLHTYTDLARLRVLYDVTDRIDLGVHGGVLMQHDTDTYSLAYGPEVGVRVIKNVWASAGYNFSGLTDEDFDDASAWNKGFYFKLRAKVDENTLSDIKKAVKRNPKEKKIEASKETVKKIEPLMDSDNDGVPDSKDKCPDTPKGVAVDKSGCPIDSDNDGVADYLDKCPDTPKGVKVDGFGCALDSDADGVPDYLDKCPDTPKGVRVDKVGCPLDSDKDSIPDFQDKCPETPSGVAVDLTGCPLDSDGDNVSDYRDKCPGTPKGVAVDENGCWTLHGVLFEYKEWKLKKAIYPSLKDVVKVLKANPELKIEVQGHTDNIGNDKYNQDLSNKRAKAVADFIISQGIAADRISYKGYGFSKPIASNDTEKGRAMNRRVEFQPIY